MSTKKFKLEPRHQGYKEIMLNSTEHEIHLLIKTKIPTNEKFLALSLSDVVLIMLINVKMTTIVGILTFMNRINFVLSSVEHGKKFKNLEAGYR